MTILIWFIFIAAGLISGAIALALLAKLSFLLGCIVALVCFGVFILVGAYIVHGPQLPPNDRNPAPSRAAPFVLGALFSYWLHHRK